MHANTTRQATRPVLRGYLHLVCACLSPFALAALLVLAQTPRGYVAASVFGAGLVVLYSISSANHLLRLPPRLRAIVARADHAAIFLFIAATYTPFLLYLSTPWAAAMLPSVWTLALAGAALLVTWSGIPRWFAAASYAALGWMGIVAANEVASVLNPLAVVLCIAAGLVFTAGALVYALRRPDPIPHIFGYHEVFHALVVAGTVVFYGVIANLLVSG